MVQGRVKSLSGRTKMLAASIAFVIGIVSAWFIRDSVLYERTDEARIDGQIIPLSARISGQVQQVNVIEGEAVHAGDVLAVLDPKEYSLAVYKAIANLAYPENTAAGLYFQCSYHGYHGVRRP